MKTSDLYILMDECVATSKHLNGLQMAMTYSHQKLDSSALDSCFALLNYLGDKQASQQATLFEAYHRLNIVNNAVNGRGA